MKSPTLFSVLVLVPILVACGRSEEVGKAATGGSGGKPAQTRAPSAVPARGDPSTHLDRFQFGDATDANGIVVKETSLIPPGSTAAVSLYLRNAPAGTQMRIVWNDMVKNVAVGEEVKSVGDQGFVAFQQPKPLPAGSYRVTMYFKQPQSEKWEDLGSHDFKVGS